MTDCKREVFVLEGLGRRRVEVDFSAGRVSSDGGGLLLREVDRRLRFTERLAHCFRDFRNPDLIEHTIRELVAQRVYGLALGYEDLNDHEQLSRDPLFAAMVGKTDVDGRDRVRDKDVGRWRVQALWVASSARRRLPTKRRATRRSCATSMRWLHYSWSCSSRASSILLG